MNAQEFYEKQYAANKNKGSKELIYTKADMVKFAVNYRLYRILLGEEVTEHKEDFKIETTEQVINKAKKAVEFITGVTFDQMNKNTRSRKIVYPKYMFYTLLKRYSNMRLHEIGELFFRYAWSPIQKKNVMCHANHASVISGLRKIDNVEFIGSGDEWHQTWEAVHKTFLTVNINEITTSQG